MQTGFKKLLQKKIKPPVKILIFSILLILIFPWPAFPADNLKIAVLPFQNLNSSKEYNWVGQGFSETLISSFANIKSVQVVERLLMNKILKEIAFQNSGFLDKDSSVKVGKLTGANVIVSGSY